MHLEQGEGGLLFGSAMRFEGGSPARAVAIDRRRVVDAVGDRVARHALVEARVVGPPDHVFSQTLVDLRRELGETKTRFRIIFAASACAGAIVVKTGQDPRVRFLPGRSTMSAVSFARARREE